MEEDTETAREAKEMKTESKCDPKPTVPKGCKPPCGRVRNMFTERDHPGISFGNTSRTKQSFKDECDINLIMARYQKTGAIDHYTNNEPYYDDINSIDFTQAMQTVARANSLFEELPSSLRQRFDNEPTKFLDFVQDPANADEMVELGLRDRTINDPPSSEFTASQPPSTEPVPDPGPTPEGDPD